MNASVAKLRSFIDAASDRIARAIAAMQRDGERERSLREAEHRARMAELDARIASVAALERQVADRLSTLKDGDPGKSVTVEEVAPLIEAAVERRLDGAVAKAKADIEAETVASVDAAFAAIPPPPEPPDVAGMIAVAIAGVDEQRAQLRALIDGLNEKVAGVAAAVAALPEPEPGKSVTVDDVAPMIAERVDRAVAAAVAALPEPEPGKSVTVDDVAPMIAEIVQKAVAEIPPAKPGEDADPDKVAAIVRETLAADLVAMVDDKVRDAVEALPPAAPGRDADPEVVAALVDEKVREAVAALPPPLKGDPGPPGALPIVKAWEDKVYYQGDVVSHDGGLYQAARDTGRSPPHDDWMLIVRAGRDGRSFTVRETYAEGIDYRALDVVALNGAAFVARRDDPGPCPGEGWQMIAMQGKPGKPGERVKPLKGDAGPPVVSMNVDDMGLLTLVNGDGTTVTCDLYPLLSSISGHAR